MSRSGRAAVMLTIGIILAGLLWTGEFGWFVQQRMRIPLLLGTAVLVAFGAGELVAGDTKPRDAKQRDANKQRRVSAGPTVGWMMVLPLLVLLSVAPTGLGAAAADRVDAYIPVEPSEGFTSLAVTDHPLDLPVSSFLDRAVWDDSRSLEDVTVRLEGLVVNDPALTDGFKLTRFMVSCCAADGIPLQVTVHHSGPPLPNDTWVIADVVWRPPSTPYQETPTPWTIAADAIAIQVIPDAPNDPYESPY